MTDAGKEMELTPCECVLPTTDDPWGDECEGCEHLRELGLTRENFTAMKAKAARCERVESASKALGETVAEQSVLIDELRARVAELEATIAEAEAMLPADAEAAHFAQCMLQAVARLTA